MPDLSPAQMKVELKALNEENEELRYKVKEHDRMRQMGVFTIADVMQMRGVENGNICSVCTGLGVSPIGSNERCPQCGGSGDDTNHWAVLQ